MQEEEEKRIIELIIKMIEQSNDRMKMLTARDKDGYYEVNDFELSILRVQQKEFEMQMKLLDKIVKNWKKGGGFVDITPESSQIKRE